MEQKKMILQPIIRPVPKQDRYELIVDYDYTCTIDGIEYNIRVPHDFIYDGASIPAPAWILTFTPFHPDVMAPALVHDYLYSGAMPEIDRQMADSIFYQLLIENEVDKATAEIMFQAVRIGGGSHWESS